MGGIKGLLQRIWTGQEERSTLANPDADLLAALGVQATASGVHVTPESAMRLSAVSACVRLISESIASLPLHVYRRLDERKRVKVIDVPAHRLLHDEPNPLMTSFTMRETMSAQLLLWGKALAVVIRNQASEPVEILPVHPSRVQIRRSDLIGLVYDVRLPNERTITVGQADMIHVPGLSFDGIESLSPIRYAAQSIGLGIAAEQYGAAFFGNGSTPSGYLTMAERLSPEQVTTLRNSWYASYGGVANSNKTAVLFGGAKFERISIPPSEAQFVEARKFQVAEIARWYRVPPHMIGDLEKATFSNIEHQALEFVTHTLRPWLVRWEQELNRKLFPTSTAGVPSDLYVEFNVDGLLRGDIKSRSDYYIRGRQWGWLSANDIRALENMDPIDNGDVYLSPLNMVQAGDPAADPQADTKQGARA